MVQLMSSLIELQKMTNRTEQSSASAQTTATGDVVRVQVGRVVDRLAVGIAAIYVFCLSPLIIISAGAERVRTLS